MVAALGVHIGFAASPPRPDIVVFLTDDQSQLDATPYAQRGIRTPNMQRLAEAGLTFERAFVASPSCAPSRAALLTGLMPARNGAEPNHSKPRADLKKWPAYFQELGYEVVAFGKVSHYRHTKDYGFDHFAHDTFHDHAAIPAAVDYLRNRPKENPRPLCLMVGSNWPHVPWPREHPGYDPASLTLPSGSIDTPETRDFRARYAAAVSNADADLGAILTAAGECLPPDTLFLFTADHGAQWPFEKWNLYESGVCVPLVVVWPGVVEPGTRTRAMVQWTDLLPTLVEAAGGTTPEAIDGRSFLPVLRGETAVHRKVIFTTHSGDGRMNVYPMRAIRTADWKLILNLHPEFAFTTHIDKALARDGGRYWISWYEAARTDPAAAQIVKRYHERPAVELYDLRSDPHEQHNLSADPAQVRRIGALRSRLERWMTQQGDQRQVFHEPRLLSDPAATKPGVNSGTNTPDRP
jgi:arylsulfatase A-like enzyme